jgi:hypothetical protein
MSTKRCTRCKTSKPRDAFHTNNNAPDGLQTRCRECRQQQEDQRRTKTRARYIALKLTLACVDCDWKPTTAEETVLLEFDHIDPSLKTGNVGFLAGTAHPWQRIQQEIDKCVPRCVRCHRLRTTREGHWVKEAESEPIQVVIYEPDEPLLPLILNQPAT